MGNMFKRLFTRRRRQAPRNPAGLTDRRAPRAPAPMPRMRYY
jgi:hypothetical protein